MYTCGYAIFRGGKLMYTCGYAIFRGGKLMYTCGYCLTLSMQATIRSHCNPSNCSKNLSDFQF